MQPQITERRDGVQLRKYFADEEFYLPSVVYEFSSERESDARVQVVETLPAGLEPEHVGFHTRLGQEDWQLTADRLECETTVEANGEHRTVYALRPELDYDAEDVITEPDDFEVEPAESVAVVGGSPGTFTRSAGSDGEEEPPASDDAEDDTATERSADHVTEDPADGWATKSAADQDTTEDQNMDDQGTEDVTVEQAIEDVTDDTDGGLTDDTDGGLTDDTDGGLTDDTDGGLADDTDGGLADVAGAETGEDATTGEDPTVEGSTGEDPTAGESTPVDAAAGSLVSRLVAELQAGTVSEENREYLRAELVDASETPGSVDARIKRLQADVSDLRAYSDAMAEFLDEQGSAEDVIDGFRSRLDAFESELASVESTLAEHDARLSAFQDQLEAVEAELDSVSSELSAVGTDIEELSAELARFDEQLPAGVEDRLAEIESELDDVSQFTDALEQAIRR